MLILGGSTAVGSIAVQLGKAAGARVVATASSSPAAPAGNRTSRLPVSENLAASRTRPPPAPSIAAASARADDAICR